MAADECGASLDSLAQDGFRFAFSLCNQSQDAEDLVQEAVARLYKKYGGIAKKALLYKTIRNIFYDHCRRSKVVSFVSYESDEQTQLRREGESEGPTAGESLDISEALSVLRPAERELIFLRYNDGLSAADIAEVTNKGRGHILSALNRAEKKMRSHMTNSFQQENGPRGNS